MLHIIANPASSSGNGRKIWQETEQILKDRNIEYKLYETTAQYDAKRFAEEITCDDSKDVIVVIGGDGTLHEVFNGIKDFSNVTLGYIPSGSGGDFARDLNISRDPMSALNTILSPKEFKLMDVGHVENPECSKNFAVSCGIGFNAAVGLEAGSSPLKKVLNKFKLGALTYTFIALKQIAGAKKNGCTLILDDARKIHYDNFYFVVSMIHRYEGGGFMFCPDAKCDDGYIDVCAVGNINKLKIINILPKAYTGGHVKYKNIDTYRAKKVTVISDTPLAIHTDGEYAGFQKELTTTICDKKIRVIVR